MTNSEDYAGSIITLQYQTKGGIFAFRTTLHKLTERPFSPSISALTAQKLMANRYMLTVLLNLVEWMLKGSGEKS